MSLLGGRMTWSRAATLLLVWACILPGLSGCEYADDGPSPAITPSRTTRPASSQLPSAPDLGNVENRNFTALSALLGDRPENASLEGIGRLSGDGFRKSVSVLAEGTYSVTAACAGMPRAHLTISQAGILDGHELELSLDCGKATRAEVDFSRGPVQVHAFYPTTGPASGAVAGFWIAPAPPTP